MMSVKRVMMRLLRLGSVASASVFLSVSARAVEVTDAQAAAAAENFVAAGGSMGVRLDGGVSDVQALTPVAGGGAFRVVRFAQGGYIVTSGDTEDEPFVFISDGDGVAESPDSPLWALLQGAMKANASARARARGRAKAGAAPRPSLWEKWLSPDAAAGRTKSGYTYGSPKRTIGDVCVPELLGTRWNQSQVGGVDLYNRYTPLKADGVNRALCGCAATACAQIMRYYEYPNYSIEPVTRKCSVERYDADWNIYEVPTNLTTQGGIYDWANMPKVPEAVSLTDGQRDAIGKLTSDMGITANMDYRESGSGAYTKNAASALREVWGYPGATYIYPLDGTPENLEGEVGSAFTRISNLLLPNIAYGCPVYIGIRRRAGGAHAVVADGYGYSDGRMYIHVNMGWGGTSLTDIWSGSGWFRPSNIDEYDDGIYEAICNISPATNRIQSLFSGRVFGVDGTAQTNCEVTAVDRSGNTFTTRPNQYGVYCFNVAPGRYSVSTETDDGATAANVVRTYANTLSSAGNVAGVDLRLMPKTGFAWTGGGDGASFGDAANWECGLAPTNGSTLVFTLAGDKTFNNDIAGFGPKRILFMDSDHGCSITNKALSGVGSVVNLSTATNTFNVAVSFAGDIDVTGWVAFTGGGSANGVKPVNHTVYLGTYNLSGPDWTPEEGATIPGGSTVSVPSILSTGEGRLKVESNGTLNVSDVLLTNDTAEVATVAYYNRGRINVNNCLEIQGQAHGYPFMYGGGTIYAKRVYSNSSAAGFKLNVFNKDSAMAKWRIGDGGLVAGPNCAASPFWIDVSGNGAGARLTANADFSVNGRQIGVRQPLEIYPNGHVVTVNAVLCRESGSIVANGAGTVVAAYDTDRNGKGASAALTAPVTVTNSAVFALNAGSKATTGAFSVAGGSTLSLPQAGTGTATLGGDLNLGAGSCLVVSNLVAGTTPLSVASLSLGGTVTLSLGGAPLADGQYIVVTSSSDMPPAVAGIAVAASAVTASPCSVERSADAKSLLLVVGDQSGPRPYGIWTGRGDGTRMSDPGNWLNLSVPRDGDVLDFTSVASATTVEADMPERTFATALFVNRNVSFSGDLHLAALTNSVQDVMPSIAAGAVLTVEGDLVVTASGTKTTMYTVYENLGTLVVKGRIVADAYAHLFACYDCSADAKIIADGLVCNANSSADHFKLEAFYGNAPAVNWIIGARGLSATGAKNFFIDTAKYGSGAVIRPQDGDIALDAALGLRNELVVNTSDTNGVGRTVRVNRNLSRDSAITVKGGGTFALSGGVTVAKNSSDQAQIRITAADTGVLEMDAGSKTMGSVVIQSGTTLFLPVSSSAAAASIGETLTLEGGATLCVSNLVAGGSAPLALGSLLTVGDESVQVLVTGDAPLAAGTYTILPAAAALSDADSFSVSSGSRLAAGTAAALSVSGGALVLTVAPGETDAFAAGDEVALAGGSAASLSDGQAAWLNGLGPHAAVSAALAGVSTEDFDRAYLLNLDVTKAGFGGGIEVVAVDFLSAEGGSLRITVGLHRTNAVETVSGGRTPINGILRLYHATAPDGEYEDCGEAVAITDGVFAESDTATCELSTDGVRRFCKSAVVPRDGTVGSRRTHSPR